MGGLFGENRVTLDERSLLLDRWLQDGSVLVNESEDITANTTMYAVTSGKTLYVTDIDIHLNTAGGALDTMRIVDGAGGVVKRIQFLQNYIIGDIISMRFSTPVAFSTAFYVREFSGAINVRVSFQGWEE